MSCKNEILDIRLDYIRAAPLGSQLWTLCLKVMRITSHGEEELVIKVCY